MQNQDDLITIASPGQAGMSHRTLVEHLPVPVVRYDRHLRPVRVSRAAAEAFDAFDGERWRQLVRQVLDTGEGHDAEIDVGSGGQRRWYQARAVPERDEHGAVAHVLVVSTDITALKQREFDLAHRSLHDPLTGLANRALLLDFLERSLTRRRDADAGPAVLFIDLDRFKRVNDSLGHRAGDALLVGVARRLESVVRPADLIARLGGDELVLVIDDVDDPREPARVAQRLRDELAAPFEVDGSEVVTTASIGIAMATHADVDAAGLLRDADAAMYLAKANGRDRFEIYDAVLRAQAGRHLQRESALRRAVAGRELDVFYQPEIDLRTGTVAAFEALLRWNHPTEGRLAAGAFIDLAEESGSVVGIGGWALTRACAEAARRSDRVGLRVNLSARQLLHVDLVATVRAALDGAGLDPSRLRLEIAEGALIDETECHLDALTALRGLGVRLGLDDVGTGRPSLAYLTRLPVDTVHVDRAVVSRLGTEDDDGAAAVVAAVIALARPLRRRVVATGVETRTQLAVLRELGCDAAQGRFFSPPRPAAAAWSRPASFPVAQ